MNTDERDFAEEAYEDVAVPDDDRIVYSLSESELSDTRAKIAAMNARAAKKGLAGLLEVTATEVRKTLKNDSGFDIEVVYWRTEIIGTAPQYAGWTFIASLDFDPAAGLITRCAPGFNGLIDRATITARREGKS